MISADSLNFDVLGLIFAHLSGNDLVAAALVNRAFLNGATPCLYHTLVFAHSQAKRYPKIVSPFASLLARPYLAIHVRTCDITALPLYKGQPHHAFLTDCVRALDLCENLQRFNLASNVLPSFLKTLSTKERLEVIRVNGSVTTAQAEILIRLRGMWNIHIDHGSWCLMDVFPRWICTLSPTLTHITINMSPDLNIGVLERALMYLPGLLGLHILSCMKIEHTAVLRLLSHTPLVESLAVTIWPQENPPLASVRYSGMSSLRQLTLDTRNILSPGAVQLLWCGIIEATKHARAPLASLTLRLSEKLAVAHPFIEELLEAHAGTLVALRFINCSVNISSLKLICRRCKKLERLAMYVPVKELATFTFALSESRTLKTLVDIPEPHSMHGPRATLRHDDIKSLMTANPKLRTIISDGRSWTGVGDTGDLRITLQRMKLSPLPHLLNFY